jgi:ferric-dicitrate binding protein FerR (iron transport regulator)
MDQDQLIKYVTGNLGEDEAKGVRSWIHAEEANKNEFIRLKNIHAFASEGKHKLPIEDDFLQLNRIINQKPKSTIQLNARLYLKYAAILIAALLIGFSVSEVRFRLLSDQTAELYNEIYAPEGQISEFKLADGTRVWLNSGTRIKVPMNFDSKHRILFMEGEAFFEVTKNPKYPFFVHTNELSVKVMGTSFNVSAYQSEGNSEITLIEGKVGIKERYGQRLALLLPGQQLVYDKTTGKKIKREVDTLPYEAWRDGKMIFKDRSLEYIAERLERWYNVKIDFNSQEISKFKFTGTILKNKPLSQVLEAITLTSPVRFEIKVNTDQKNQVILYSLKNKTKMEK